jgi:hypothetical protein
MKRHVISLGAIEFNLIAPAKAGVQKPLPFRGPLDSGLRRKDGTPSFSPIILLGILKQKAKTGCRHRCHLGLTITVN